MKKQLVTMLELQDEMNNIVNDDWRNQNFEWYRAIWTECAEMMDHYGWKWWKKQNRDDHQVELELVDIWHFGLSDLLVRFDTYEAICGEIESGFKFLDNEQQDFRILIEQFACDLLLHQQFNPASFAALMKGIGMDMNRLFKLYVGKNILNRFRQENGYQDGSYRKQWMGKEDNEHLVEVLQELDPDADDFIELLYQQLLERYYI